VVEQRAQDVVVQGRVDHDIQPVDHTLVLPLDEVRVVRVDNPGAWDHHLDLQVVTDPSLLDFVVVVAGRQRQEVVAVACYVHLLRYDNLPIHFYSKRRDPGYVPRK
jgi:hypothetical protein